MFQRKKPDSLIMVIFGASGDLTKRKLISAICNLFVEGLLPENFAILGISRRLTRSSFQAWMWDGVSKYGNISDDVAEEMGNGITKKKIQDGFFVLVDLSIIGDDGDYDHMNYDSDGNNELIDLLQQIKIQELEKENESEISPAIYTKLPRKM